MSAQSLPLVSVVIPNYNYARYLRQAIDSVLGQTYPKVEAIVIDDGSSDQSESVLRTYGDRIRWFRQQRQGVSAARNRGIQESRGELIAFLDADDLWQPEKLAKQAASLQRPSVGMVCCGLQFISPDGQLLGTTVAGQSGQVLKEIALLRWPGSPGLGSTALIRKACVDRVGLFDVGLSTSADWDFWRRLSCAFETEMVREPLVLYRLHRTSMHCNVDVFEHDMLRAFSRAFADPEAAAIHPLRRQCYGNLYVMLSGSYLHAGRWARSLHYAMRSILTWPPSAAYLAAFPVRRIRQRLRTRIGDPSAQIVLPRWAAASQSINGRGES